MGTPIASIIAYRRDTATLTHAGPCFVCLHRVTRTALKCSSHLNMHSYSDGVPCIQRRIYWPI
jgi:hypothetical protein